MSSTEPVGSSPDGWQASQPVPGSTAQNPDRAARPNRTTGPLRGLESLRTDTTPSGHSAAVSWAPVQSQSQDFDSVIREFAGQILANPPPGDIWPALASLVPKLSDRDRILEVATGLESEDDKRVVLTLLAHQASYFTPAQL